MSASESGFFGFLEAAAAQTFGALALHFRLSQIFRRRICETGFSYGVSCVIGPIGQKIAFAQRAYFTYNYIFQKKKKMSELGI